MNVHVTGGPEPVGLLEAFDAYERALMADDVDALDRLFAPGAATLRGDREGLLVGHEQISEFRRGRGGAPQRELGDVHVQVVADDAALVVAVTIAARGGRGLQTQLWRLIEGSWCVAAAQVGAPPQTFDPTVWRVVGAPLVPALAVHGPLAGETVAVKDVFAVAGFAIGAGVPAFQSGAPVEAEHAEAVRRLLDAGAAVAGIARTDQLAYSIAGTNEHYGAPVNPAVTGAVPGGSSSGSAVAVSLGAATVGLGTDTAGSIRVPASYQGLWGLRSTHGAVPSDGLLPLAPDFDTIGLLAREASVLARAAGVLVPGTTAALGDLVADPATTALAEPSVAGAVQGVARAAGARSVSLGGLDEAYEAFRVHQAYQAWQAHGAWITDHPGAVVGAAGERFAVASRVTPADDAAARRLLRAEASRLDDVLGDGVLVLPSASSAAPSLRAPAARVDAVRAATLRLTCLAGITGRPALSIPGIRADGGPIGVCLVGPRGSDLALLALAPGLPMSS